MLAPTLILAALAFVLLGLGYFRGNGEHAEGMQIAFRMVLQVLPLLLFAFLTAGMIQVLLPQDAVSRWVGAESGWRGLLLGSVAGGLAPGGPYVSLPIAAGLVRAGAGTGTMVAFLTGWSLWAVGRIPMEVGILGWRLTLMRLASVAIFPPLAGWIAHMLFRNVAIH